MDTVVRTVRKNLNKPVCEEIAKVHGKLSFNDKQKAFLFKSEYIKARGDKKKRRRARRESEKFADYLIDSGKLEAQEKDVIISYMCPM